MISASAPTHETQVGTLLRADGTPKTGCCYPMVNAFVVAVAAGVDIIIVSNVIIVSG